jgi:hypothetical protein
MFGYILFAVIVILIISLIYWVLLSDSDPAKRARVEVLLRESAGGFDEPAQKALDTLESIKNPRPRDRFRRGQIIRYNLLEGRLRRNRAARHNIVRDFTNTLNDIGDDVRRAPADEYQDVGRAFMLHNIEEFGHDLLYNLTDEELNNQLYLGFFEAVHQHGPAVRKDIIEQRVTEAKHTASNRAEAIEHAFDSASVYTSDAQNVHDSSVNSDLRETLRKLKNTSPPITDTSKYISAAEKYINEHDDISDTKARAALRTLDMIKRGEQIGTFGDSEDRIFSYTWERSNHPRNAEKAALMRDAVVDALANSFEGGSQVCINGRAGRVLGSLATLDFDPSLGEVMTFEAYRNQIFQETKDIVNSAIENAKNSPDADMRAVGAAYEEGGDPVGEGAKTFTESLKTSIDNNIDTYSGKISDADRGNIKQECYVYATI